MTNQINELFDNEEDAYQPDPELAPRTNAIYVRGGGGAEQVVETSVSMTVQQIIASQNIAANAEVWVNGLPVDRNFPVAPGSVVTVTMPLKAG